MPGSGSVPPSVQCPRCAAELAVLGLHPGMTVVCTNCRTCAKLKGKPHGRRVSRQANASAFLGAMSVLGFTLTGLPAIVLGIRALREIRRHPGRILGKGRSAFGILCGLILGVVAPYAALHLLPFLQMITGMLPITDPTQIAHVLEEFPVHQRPAGLTPMVVMNNPTVGMRMVVYQSSTGVKGPSAIILDPDEEDPEWIDFLRNQAKSLSGRSGIPQPDSTEELNWQIGGKAVAIHKAQGVDATSKQNGLEYYAQVPSSRKMLYVLVFTPNPPFEESPGENGSRLPKNYLTEKEVRAFFESFR